MRYWRVIGHYNGEATTYEALAGTFQTSPYNHDENAKLKAIRVVANGEAATSLMEGIQFRLSCTAWKPNVMHVVGSGNGLCTVPKIPPPVLDYEVDEPVQVGVPITIEARHAVATAVTCNVLLLGLFES